MTDLPDQVPIRVDQFLTFKIARLHNKLNAQAARRLREVCGLSLPQWRVLACIAVEGEISASQLIRFMNIDKGLLSRALKTLQNDGLVISTTSKVDLRVHWLELSESGKKVYKDVVPLMASRQARILSIMTEEERQAFESMLERLELLVDADEMNS